MNATIKAKRTNPTTPITDFKFTYQRGADVQATWRRFGWVPPSESRPPLTLTEAMEFDSWEPMRRVK